MFPRSDVEDAEEIRCRRVKGGDRASQVEETASAKVLRWDTTHFARGRACLVGEKRSGYKWRAALRGAVRNLGFS